MQYLLIIKRSYTVWICTFNGKDSFLQVLSYDLKCRKAVHSKYMDVWWIRRNSVQFLFCIWLGKWSPHLTMLKSVRGSVLKKTWLISFNYYIYTICKCVVMKTHISFILLLKQTFFICNHFFCVTDCIPVSKNGPCICFAEPTWFKMNKFK